MALLLTIQKLLNVTVLGVVYKKKEKISFQLTLTYWKKAETHC